MSETPWIEVEHGDVQRASKSLPTGRYVPEWMPSEDQRDQLYARQVALGLLGFYSQLMEARDLLYSIQHPLADRLAEAIKLAMEVQRDLAIEAAV